MAPNIFMCGPTQQDFRTRLTLRRTGTTGYIGGTVLDTIVKKHPEYDITVLLRNVPNTFSERYPKVKIVKGDYDSFDIISKAASEADVVVRM